MIFSSTRLVRHIAIAAALSAALGLGACGRKGPLDPPPSAAIPAAPAPVASKSPGGLEDPFASQAKEERSLFGDATQRNPGTAPVAPKGAKRSIPLDVLLD